MNDTHRVLRVAVRHSKDPVPEDIARAFHDAYEVFSDAEGWETQPSTRVPFEQLPEANKRVMLRTVQFLIDCGVIL